MIFRWVKREDYWTSISSSDFVRDLRYRGYSETRGHGSSNLKGLKKNGMWLLRYYTSELLRQGNATDTGFILWGCPDISGGGSQAGSVQKVWKSETGEAPMSGKQSFLHKAIFLLRGEEMPKHDRQGRCERIEAGLARSQGIGEGIHAGAASEKPSGSASGNRHRRTILAERTYLSDIGKRPGAKTANLVWRGRPV